MGFSFASQKGQDEWVIKNIFNYKRDGYFVDLAAYDGIVMSNTIKLEKELGWTGICIEGHPDHFIKLSKNRNCHLSNEVIDYKNDNEVKFRIDALWTAGIVGEDMDNNIKHRPSKMIPKKTITVKTKTLEFILDKFNAPKTIDYLNLDVEGAETRVLKNFPFDKYKFLTMTIERPTTELEKLLFTNDYVFVMKSKLMEFDSYYVHRSIPNFDDIVKEPYSPTPRKPWYKS